MTADEIVRRAADRLAAAPVSRRGLFAGMAGAVAGAVLIPGCGDTPADARNQPPDCGIGRRNINVCYTPYRVVRSESSDVLPKGYEGVAVRKGPEPDAPIVYKHGEPCVIRLGGVYGRQSERDGGVQQGCPAPPERAGRGAGRGFYWGYPGPRSGAHNKGGWIAGELRGVRHSEPDPAYDGIFCGPANLDFDCRAGSEPDSRYKLRCGTANRPRYRCGGHGPFYGSCSDPRLAHVGIYLEPAGIDLMTSLSHERYNLKYEADGTTIFWLVPGDRVMRYCTKCTERNPSKRCPPQTYHPKRANCCRSYTCVTVVSARHAPTGLAGWINTSVLFDSEAEARSDIRRALRHAGGSFDGY